MINNKLEKYLNKRINEPTVILCFKILLNNRLKKGPNATMTKTQIGNIFDLEHRRYGIATFRRDYVLRQCGHDENAIDQDNDLFYVKETFLQKMTNDEIAAVIQRIDEHWSGFESEQISLINEIRTLIDGNDVTAKQKIIVDMLTSREAIKRGQAFEVTSYAVLSTFLYSLGFSLNRFSTTYSNDGGIDFVGQNAIYQVTTKLNQNKFNEDIQKVTGKNRVLVFKDKVSGFNDDSFQHNLVLNYIDKDELQRMLSYLFCKNRDRYLNTILSKMKDEFEREFYQNEYQQ